MSQAKPSQSPNVSLSVRHTCFWSRSWAL